jgi:D-beta-D-heptose 7-phosphate kinase/D-beta-D-heptose 1-phosphate adenosyltransferase
MNKTEVTYQQVIGKFTDKDILVIGDFILDVYVKGVSTRLSPEAPVPVVDIAETSRFLGGAGNVVCNLRSLGAKVTFCTAIGADHEGDEALELLEKTGVKKTSILRSAERRTISKTRVLASGHVITRFDQGDHAPLNIKDENKLIDLIAENYQSCDAVLISDYDKGVLTEKILSTLITLQGRWPKFVAVDSKRLDFFYKLHPHLVKPNYDECVKLLKLKHKMHNRMEQVSALSAELYEKVNAELIAVTLDAEGSLILEMGQPVVQCKAPAVSMPHVAGAGDTYLSTFLLVYILTEDCKTSAEIATAAATIAVKKELTSSCSNVELASYFGMQQKFVSTLEELKMLCEGYRAQGKRIVFTNGCFDILHSGHVTYLHCARDLGDVLIVGVNRDESIKRLKGESRPINPLHDRLKVLSGLTSVDHVVTFGDEGDDTPIPVISIVKPEVFAKGGDYTKEKLPEASTIEEYGGQIVFLPQIPDHSTTLIINRISNGKAIDQALLSKLQ